MTRRRALRVVGTLLVTGLGTAYLLWKIDVGETAHVIANAKLGYVFGSLGIMAASVLPMAWRWQLLLAARGIRERLGWLVRAYFVSYTVGQVLPTSIGGDASRIYETTRRHPGAGGPVAGAVLLERALGGAATLVLAAIGFVLAIGRYDVGAYLWVEAAFVVATIVAAVVLFSRRVRRPLARVAPLLDKFRVGKPIRAVYEGIHG
ncbi:MAG: lysylphosphatidylglycerol synthase transmembrane domain-containing protein, partial [Thermoleophilia bacterium]